MRGLTTIAVQGRSSSHSQGDRRRSFPRPGVMHTIRSSRPTRLARPTQRDKMAPGDTARRIDGAERLEVGDGKASAQTSASGRGDEVVNSLSVNIAEDLVERIAERAAELLVQRASQPAEDGWLRGADKIAAYIDSPRSRVYALASARRIPVHHDGSALIARRSELDQWLRSGGGRRP